MRRRGPGGTMPAVLWHRLSGIADGTDELLLLLHGQGGTSELWDGVLAELAARGHGPTMVVDLSGHGRSPHASVYDLGLHAAAVADTLESAAGHVPIRVLGHSLGGAVGLMLASGWFGTDVRHVTGVGIKCVWSREDLDRGAELRRRPPRCFASRDEAAARFVKVNGLEGLVDPASPQCDAGVFCGQDGWYLANDARSFPAEPPAVDQLVRLARCPVVLARGSHDALVSTEQLRRLGVEPVVLPGLGHNAHVEDPASVAALIADAA